MRNFNDTFVSLDWWSIEYVDSPCSFADLMEQLLDVNSKYVIQNIQASSLFDLLAKY